MSVFQKGERASADHLDASAGSRTQMIRRDFCALAHA
jgi:hypothetical protein